LRVLVTGSRGFVGQLVMAELERRGHTALACDVDEGAGDILSEFWDPPQCDAVIHLAADKYAGVGEEFPARTADLNVRGTQHVVDNRWDARVVLASTCKAAAPITCYGASKLIAERIVLNAGGTVLRLVNVLGSSGSVTDVWDDVPESEPLPVTECVRMWMRASDAARLLVRALGLYPGRYAPARSGYRERTPEDVAAELYPGREVVTVPLRRGDRPIEKLTNEYEQRVGTGSSFDQILDVWERESRWARTSTATR
jgi:FlaA1/EpsC-like NDP-sugar epimerase